VTAAVPIPCTARCQATVRAAPTGDGRLAVTLTVGAQELSNRIIGL